MKHRAKSEFDFVNYLESYKQGTFLSKIYPKPPIYFFTNIHPIQNLFEPEDSPSQEQHPSVFWWVVVRAAASITISDNFNNPLFGNHITDRYKMGTLPRYLEDL